MHTVAIIGRPNVGKSTLFNRITGQRKAIVDDISGVTRDRLYGEAEWNGKTFNIIDTGGFVANSDDVFEKAVRQQVKIAVEEAHILLFVVDVTTGITNLDDEVADLLRKTEKTAIVVVNKVDNNKRLLDVHEFYSFGFEEVHAISSINGSGTGDLLDAVTAYLPENQEATAEEEVPRIAIIGQPNVGKSSLINMLVEEDRNIVTDIAGTTRDTVHTRFNKFGMDLMLIDTAGIRKKSKVRENLEFYSVIRAVKALDKADVAILMIDASKGITTQDINIFALATRKKRGILLAVNKWDLVEKLTYTAKEFTEKLKNQLAPFSDVPIIFCSVHEKQRILKILDGAIQVYKNRKQRIATSQLNEVMLKAIEAYPPPAHKGKFITIKYVTQLKTQSPTFAFFTNHPKYIKEPYRNYLENKLRSHFNFTGVPVSIFFRQK